MDTSRDFELEKVFLLREKHNGQKTSAYESDLLRLHAGEPLAYIIGFIPFLGAKIFLDSHPLIPRPETEYWTEEAVREITVYREQFTEKEERIKILDLCAGSGAIGVAVLQRVPGVLVDFADIDSSHFPTIQKNVRTNGIDESLVHILESDIWSAITDTYDFILSNPPYLSKNRTDRIETSVLQSEPEKALFAEENGFALIRKILEGLDAHLKPKGVLYIEHEPEHEETLKELAHTLHFKAETLPDQYGVLRYSIIRRLKVESGM
ncbi:MAG: HemK family protein methyltransferase [Patescibacteria group bacterium]